MRSASAHGQAGYMRADRFDIANEACKRRRVHTCTESTIPPDRLSFLLSIVRSFKRARWIGEAKGETW